MKSRNLLAIAILVLGSIAALYSYSRLAQLLPMSDPGRIETTQAVITDITAPMIKKGESSSDVASHVRLAFKASGRTITGGYTLTGREQVPEKNAHVDVAYRVDRPEVFLRATEYEELPRELSALRWMMWIFALIAMIAPFAVMKHGS